eukprot:21117-Heterococcus_DN1.PRE.3
MGFASRGARGWEYMNRFCYSNSISLAAQPSALSLTVACMQHACIKHAANWCGWVHERQCMTVLLQWKFDHINTHTK